MREEPDEDLLHEMAFSWTDIEKRLKTQSPNVYEALQRAYRVEAVIDANNWGDPQTIYDLYFDAADEASRSAARVLKDADKAVESAIKAFVDVWDSRYTHNVRVVPAGREGDGVLCERLTASPANVPVEDVPTEKPSSQAPLTQRDGYWLTPIEVPFYDALRETGATFAVQPWIQGVDGKYRPDFIVFYNGASVVVELDGHDFHKTKEQRAHDNRKARWFEKRGMKLLRYTGSEVHADAQSCVKDLLDVLRQSQARF